MEPARGLLLLEIVFQDPPLPVRLQVCGWVGNGNMYFCENHAVIGSFLYPEQGRPLDVPHQKLPSNAQAGYSRSPIHGKSHAPQGTTRPKQARGVGGFTDHGRNHPRFMRFQPRNRADTATEMVMGLPVGVCSIKVRGELLAAWYVFGRRVRALWGRGFGQAWAM